LKGWENYGKEKLDGGADHRNPPKSRSALRARHDCEGSGEVGGNHRKHLVPLAQGI